MRFSGLTERLDQLRVRMSMAYYLHASNPRVRGNDREHLRIWATAQAAQAALVERNPAFAQTLLPVSPALPWGKPGLPLLPAGVRYVADEAGPGTITFTVEVAGVTLEVTTPSGRQLTPAPTAGATRTTITFKDEGDGLYEVKLLVVGAYLTTVYFPVCRAQFRALRENNRDAAYAFEENIPHPSQAFVSRLARLIAADAAAASGKPQLFADMMAACEEVPTATSTPSVYPHRHV